MNSPKKNLFILAGISFILLAIPFTVYLSQQRTEYRGRAALSNTYYVAQDGSGDFTTIQAATNTAQPGDTFIVRSGNYDERVSITASGISGAPIIYQAQDTVTVDGGFHISGDYIKIDGFRVTGATTCSWSATDYNIYVSGDHVEVVNCYIYEGKRGGLQTTTSSDSCTIKNNEFYQNGEVGIEVHGTNHLIENNDIHDTRCAPCNTSMDGIFFFGSGHQFIGNRIYDITFANNPGHTPHVDAFQTWRQDDPGDPPISSNMTFDGNYINLPDWQAYHEYGKGWEIEGLTNSIIKNNIVIAHTPIGAWAGHGNQNLTIVNNTFIGNLNPACNLGSECWMVAIELEGTPDCTIKNNIFVDWASQHASIRGTSTNGLDMDYNLVYRSDGQTLSGEPGPHDIWGEDPRFVNLAGNFHLQSDSLAIDAGATLAEVTNDYEGNPRPQGAGYDIGAYEYTSGVQPTPTPQPTSTPTPTPTPTPPIHCPPLGDIDCSGKVSSLDFSYLIAHFNTDDVTADLDDSELVNSLDVSCLLANFGLEDPNQATCRPENF